MASDIPAFLEVGTPVSAKFKGAFCEATIKSVKKSVKCKVQFKDGSGSAVINDEFIEGELKLNALVQTKQDGGEARDAVIQKMNDHSLYTVVFDDGDERTLRRTNVCVMGERHFQEHENLDNLPLTDPENFLTPVLLSSDKRRKRRRSQPNLDEDDSDSDGTKPGKRWSEIDKEYLGKVVCIEQGERRKSWFPALGLKHFGNHPDNQVYVQSFKDGKKMLVKKEDVKDFSKEKEPLSNFLKGETKTDPILRSAIEKALAYHDLGELPKGWNILDTIDEKEESSDDDVSAPLVPVLSSDAKAFQDNVYSFMSRQGTPLTKPPTINNQGVSLHKLYELVLEIGGMDEVSNQQWRHIYTKLGLRNMHTTASYNMKTLYKRYLYPYEEHLKSSAKSSPSRQQKPKSKRNATKEDNDKSSTISESDSEPDRRRSTRSTKAMLDRSFEGSAEKKKRPNLSSRESTVDETVEKSTSKGLFLDVDVKFSEAEDVDVVNSPETSDTSEDTEHSHDTRDQVGKYKMGSKIAIRYGSGKNQRIYNAKILDVGKEEGNGEVEVVYRIHYNGWNHRYDEWVKEERIQGFCNIPNRRKNIGPPLPTVKVPKDLPQKFKAKVETDALPILPAEHTTTEQMTPTTTPITTPVSKPVKSPVIEKPPSPLKSPTYAPEPLFLSESTKHAQHTKKTLHPKAVNDALFIPDFKPSPVKPRTTRNSMQDTILLNALVESIGKPNQSAVNIQSDPLMKSESSTVNRRRSNRQQITSQKSDNAESDLSSKDEKEDYGTKRDDVKEEPTTSTTFSDHQASGYENYSSSKKPLPLDPKESSKEDSVKKWIEDSSKLMSKTSLQKTMEEGPKIEPCDPSETSKVDEFQNKISQDDEKKKGRKIKTKKEESKPNRKRRNDETDSDNEEKESTSAPVETIKSDNNNLQSEKDRTSETAQTLSDFCNIVENIPKLQASESVEESVPDTRKEANSPQKDLEKSRKKKHDKKRRRTQSTIEVEALKSPKEKKEKRVSPPLQYNIDFMSDLENVLAEKNCVDRIVIMQSRLNAMRKLYSKLRTEVASIDRRKRRKLRKQMENKQRTSVS